MLQQRPTIGNLYLVGPLVIPAREALTCVIHFAFFGGGGGNPRTSRLSRTRALDSWRRRKLAFEPLEDRSLLSVCVWNGSVNNHWATAGNWDVAPQPGDQLQFPGTASTSTRQMCNDFPAGTSFQSIELDGDNFSLTGNDLAVTGSISVASGVSGSTISLNVALAGPVAVNVADTALTISGNLSGSNYLTKAGSGTLTLSGANSYSGGTLITDGTLQVGNDAALVQCGNGLLVDGANAELDLNGHNVNIGQLGLINGSITSATSASITATSYVVESGTIAVDLYGSDAPMLKGTAGSVTLSGANDYTGPTTIHAGTLQFDGPDAWSPVFSNSAGTDIRDGRLVLDYSSVGSTSDPQSDVQTDLTASYAASPHFSPSGTHKISSSTAVWPSTALGWADNTTSQQVTIARLSTATPISTAS